MHVVMHREVEDTVDEVVIHTGRQVSVNPKATERPYLQARCALCQQVGLPLPAVQLPVPKVRGEAAGQQQQQARQSRSTALCVTPGAPCRSSGCSGC